MASNKIKNRSKRLAKAAGRLGLLCAPLAFGACSSGNGPATATENVAVTSSALSDCGFALSTQVSKANKKGFKATITVTSTNGGPLVTTGLTVLVNAGGNTLTKVGHGTFQAVENGYLLSTVAGDETADDLAMDDSQPSADELAGRAYRFHVWFDGTYSSLVANVMSSSGSACDQTAPTVSLAASGDFYTSNGTLSLSANASDDVAVSKVVFAQDGVEIGTVRSAPYTLAVPVTSAINGRHRYSATAYDLTGNQAAETKRVLVAIGNKFFGTATTIAADYTNLLAHFNQVTPGNAGKWGSVEATRDQMNWTDLDTAYNFAKSNKIPFKMHTLIWGQQQPAWIDGLPADQQLAEIDQWMSAVAARYPNIDLIDVVNEPLHAPPSYAAALGGAGSTGWDWVITAFQMARNHFPNAELVLNDYSILTMASSTQDYLTIVNLLKDRGLIDGIAEQGHFYERAPELSVLTANLNSLVATGLPLYISELDLNLSNDAQQANRMRDLFSTFWSTPSVLGVTHWGYLQGNMWQSDAYLIRSDGSLRPALTYIDCTRAGGTNCTVPAYVPQPHTGDATGITLEAEQYDSEHALLPAGNVVAYANDGSWFGFSQVVFNSQWNALNVTYANGGTGSVNLTFHLDSLANAPVATVALPPTGGWGTMKTVSVPWTPLGVQHDLFVRFNGGGANVDKVQFAAPPPTTRNIVANGTFESNTSGWFTFNGGSYATSTALAHSGTSSLLVTNRGSNAPAATDLTSVVTPGTSYPFSLWAAIRSPDGSSKAINVTQATSCKAADGTVSTTYNWVAGATTLDGSATGPWVQFSGTIAVPNCNLTQLLFWVEGGAGADLYVDDVQVLAAVNPSANLITDGTFETGTGAWGNYNATTFGVVNTTAHSGTQSLKGGGMQSNGFLGRDIKALVTPGKKYTASAWVSVGNLAAGSGLVKWQTVQNCNTDSGDSYPGLAFKTVSNGTWVQVTGTVDLSACTSVNKLTLFAGADSGDLYLDDVTLTPAQ
jgi:GH35 family endo-1,4-beta-xylanase